MTQPAATQALSPQSLARWYLDRGLVARIDAARRFELEPLGELCPAQTRHAPAVEAFGDEMRVDAAAH